LREVAAPSDRSLREIAEAAAAAAEQQAIRRMLQATRGNKSEAARRLRTDYKTLHVKMKLYGIPAAPYKNPQSLQ
jgi:DNA-binding NtrC family response regulator